MRVLVLSYETPAYPAGGGPSRQHSLLEPLARRHTIRVVTTGGQPRFGRLPAGVDIRFLDSGEPAGHPPVSFIRKHLTHYTGDEPWVYRPALHHRRALQEVLPLELESFRPDVVMVEHGDLAPLVHRVPQGVASVLVLHNIFWSVQAQKIPGTGLVGAVNGVLEMPIVARRERKDARAADHVVVVTEADRRRLRLIAPRATISVVPNCVDTAYFARRADRADRPAVVMTASYHYPPNQAAVVEMIDEVFPLVRRSVPEAELALVGQGMPAEVVACAEAAPGVRVVGQVDDVRPELQRAWVALAPLRSGSGSPLKVIEALSAGVPVVATPRVRDALGIREEADGIVTGSSSADLAAGIVGVLTDPDRRDRLASAGESCACQRFDRVQAADALEAVWRSAVASRR